MSTSSASSTDDSDPTEMEGIELANVQPQPLESYDGVTAVVYNGNSDTRTVTVEFTVYDGRGNQLHQGTDTVIVDSKSQVPVSKYWDKTSENPSFQGWDAKVISVE
jgi:hypothetical protein